MTKKENTTFVWIYGHRKDESVARKPAIFTIKTRGFIMLTWPLDILREDTFDLVYIFVFLSKNFASKFEKSFKNPSISQRRQLFCVQKKIVIRIEDTALLRKRLPPLTKTQSYIHHYLYSYVNSPTGETVETLTLHIYHLYPAVLTTTLPPLYFVQLFLIQKRVFIYLVIGFVGPS